MQDLQRLIETLHPLELAIIPFLKDNNSLKALVKKSNLSETEVTRALQWLSNKKAVNLSKKTTEIIELDKNGLTYTKTGLPERRFLSVLTRPLSLNEIKEQANLDNQELNISIGLLKKRKSITVNNNIVEITGSGKKLTQEQFSEEDFLKRLPLDISSLNKEEILSYKDLKSRHRIIKTETIKDTNVKVTELGNKLINSKLDVKNTINVLTQNMLKDSSWKNKKFRRYDVKINVPRIYANKRHFVNQSIEYMKKIWLELGFKEMTGNLIQTGFWNFDALFTAQDHPARDLQDTFYIKDPEFGKLPGKKLINNVKSAHESGFTTKSKGWQYKWQLNEAKRNVLRTHTTVLSAKTIATLKKADLPVKYFSVGKVFRNETLDWKHLFEFYQVEGIVVDENANFRHLLGYLKEYYKRLGFNKIRFRPSYFPYTELSVEPEVFHPIKKEWIELGGAGIFRPEVVKPLLGYDVPVLAWGQGLERSLMDYFNIKDARDVYKNDLKQLRETKLWMK